jgi:hypothetical protein
LVLEEGFNNRWDFPVCAGALDGKHIAINRPAKSGSTFYNYKKLYIILLLTWVDYDYCFTYVDVGANGSCAVGGF